VRRAVPFAILAGCLGVGVMPALAADQAVTINDDFYQPASVAVMPGQTVTWSAAGGMTLDMHSVHFDGEAGPIEMPSTTYQASRQFPTAGEFHYHCDVHPTMHGIVFVNATGTVPVPTPTPSPTATPTPGGTPTPTPTPGGGGGGGGTPAPGPGSPGSTAAVSSFRARAARSHFCTRHTAACKKPGVFLLIDLGARNPVRVRGTLRRGPRRVRSVSLTVRPGHRRVRLPGKRLKPGGYVLTLRAGHITRRVRFRVRRS
jgi:plastocyanin